MRLKTALMMLCMSLALSACHKMVIVNSQAEPGGAATEDMHINLAFSLYEHSPPVDLKQKCPDRSWHSVTTVDTPITIILGMVDSALFIFDAWDVQSVQVECSR